MKKEQQFIIKVKNGEDTNCPKCNRKFKPVSNRDCELCLVAEAELRF